jgi:hypothetical protein
MKAFNSSTIDWRRSLKNDSALIPISSSQIVSG